MILQNLSLLSLLSRAVELINSLEHKIRLQSKDELESESVVKWRRESQEGLWRVNAMMSGLGQSLVVSWFSAINCTTLKVNYQRY